MELKSLTPSKGEAIKAQWGENKFEEDSCGKFQLINFLC